MKFNRSKFLLTLAVSLVVIIAGCDNSNDQSASTKESKNANNNLSQSVEDDLTTANLEKYVLSNDSDNTDTSNVNNSLKEKKEQLLDNTAEEDQEILNSTKATLKEEYLNKLNDSKQEVEKLKPLDSSTYALKKVENDRYDIWDGLLNEIYGVLKQNLTKEEMEQMKNEQLEWIGTRDAAAKESSLKYQGGTMEQLEYVSVLANLTEERCYELVEKYMK